MTLAGILTAGALALASPAWAGRTCSDEPLPLADVVASMELAGRTASALDATGARVVVLARSGKDLSEYGLNWSHLGLAYREQPATDTTPGVWRVVHKLNECGSDQASLYRQGLGEFFLDRMFRYQAAIAVLSPDAQDRLLPLLRDDVRVSALHTGAYSMVAYPWAQTYQQSNQWAVETMAAGLEPSARDRTRAQAWLRLKDYQPTVLRVNALKRLGADIGAANISFSDHPTVLRFSDRITTVTVDSVFDWLPRAGLGQAPIVVSAK